MRCDTAQCEGFVGEIHELLPGMPRSLKQQQRRPLRVRLFWSAPSFLFLHLDGLSNSFCLNRADDFMRCANSKMNVTIQNSLKDVLGLGQGASPRSLNDALQQSVCNASRCLHLHCIKPAVDRRLSSSCVQQRQPRVSMH
jgi:hypothetical protein